MGSSPTEVNRGHMAKIVFMGQSGRFESFALYKYAILKLAPPQRRDMGKKGKAGYDTHHRRPRSKGGTNHPDNLIRLRKDKHRAWHLLVGNATPHQIAYIISKVYLDPDYELIAVRKGKPPSS